jgi:Skp family chaperone for outer membrane proteins
MKNSYKFWIIISFVVVFAAGVAGGILFEKSFLDKKPRRNTERRSSVRFPTLEMMAEELGLSSEQQEKLKEIFKNNEERLNTLRSQIHEQYSALRSQVKEEMMQVFSEEQKIKFEAMIEKYLAERKKEMEERNKKSPSNGHNNKGEQR